MHISSYLVCVRVQCVFVCMFASFVCIFAFVCMFAFVCIFAFVFVFVSVFVCVFVCVFACSYTEHQQSPFVPR